MSLCDYLDFSLVSVLCQCQYRNAHYSLPKLKLDGMVAHHSCILLLLHGACCHIFRKSRMAEKKTIKVPPHPPTKVSPFQNF